MKRMILAGIALGTWLPYAHAQQTGGVPSLAQQVQTLQQQVATLLTTNQTLQTTVAALQTTVTNQQTSLTTLQSTVVNVQSNNTSLQNALSAETQARKDADAALQSLIAAGFGDVYSNSSGPESLQGTPVVATLSLPAGTYLAVGKVLFSRETDGTDTTCALRDNPPFFIDFSQFKISPIVEGIFFGGVTTTVSIQSSFTLTNPAVITLVCSADSGNVLSAELDAIRVGQMHHQ